MKSFLLSVLAIVGLASPVRADLLPPQPTRLTVKNLGAFPKYKFLYVLERDVFGSDGRTAKPLLEEKVLESRGTVKLLVQSGQEEPQTWATVPYKLRGERITLVVDDVRSQGKTIRVIYHSTKDAAPPGQKGARAHHDSPLLLALATGGACGLVLLARRGRPVA